MKRPNITLKDIINSGDYLEDSYLIITKKDFYNYEMFKNISDDHPILNEVSIESLTSDNEFIHLRNLSKHYNDKWNNWVKPEEVYVIYRSTNASEPFNRVEP